MPGHACAEHASPGYAVRKWYAQWAMADYVQTFLWRCLQVAKGLHATLTACFCKSAAICQHIVHVLPSLQGRQH